MAQRYGGKFSPDGTPGQSPAPNGAPVNPRDSAGVRSNLMFVTPVLLAFFSLNDGATGLALGLIGAAALALGAWLNREGLRAEATYNARVIARRPALPRKIIAACLAGLGIAMAAYSNGGGLGAIAIYGIATTALHLAAFGIDPLGDKRMEGIDTFQQDRVARVVDEAEAYLAAITDHIAMLKDRALTQRVAAFAAAARTMIRTVEEDPRDLTGARKYLGVYLMGARDATARFAEVARRGPDPKARADFEALLADLETNFAAKTKVLLSDSRADMDIEIKVLRDRLQREGVTPE